MNEFAYAARTVAANAASHPGDRLVCGSLGVATDIAETLRNDLVEVLDQRFDIDADPFALDRLIDAALSPVVTINVDLGPGVADVTGRGQSAIVWIAEGIHAEVRKMYKDHDALQTGWGFSGYLARVGHTMRRRSTTS